MRTIKKIILTFIISLAALVMAAGILGYAYEDELKEYFISKLNQNLTSEVKVGSVNVSFIRKFPYGSVELNDLVIYEPGQNSKSRKLLVAQSAFFQFNLLKLLNKDYTIKKISVENGKFNCRIFKDGTDNFHFWKPSDEAQTAFRLDKVVLHNIEVDYQNFYKGRNIYLNIDELAFKGNFWESSFEVENEISGKLVNFQNDTTSILANIPFNINSVIKVNRDKWIIEKNEGFLGDIGFNVYGSVNSTEKGSDIDLSIAASGVKLADVVELSKKFSGALDGYDIDGNVDAKFKIKGEFSNVGNPSITGEIKLNQGNIRFSGTELQSITALIDYSNGSEKILETNSITVQSFTSNLEGGVIKGQFKVEDLVVPKVKGSFLIRSDLKDIRTFFKLDTLESASGIIEASFSVNGIYRSSADWIKALQDLNFDGKAKTQDVAIHFRGSNEGITSLNSSTKWNYYKTDIENCSFSFAGSSYDIKGSLQNLLPYLSDEKNIKVISNTTINIDLLDLNKMVSEDDGKKSSSEIPFPFTPGITHCAINIGELKYKKASLKNISSEIFSSENRVVGERVVFSTMGGNCSLSEFTAVRKGGLVQIAASGEVKSISLRSLFADLENFGQEVLTDKNIDGVADAEFVFSGEVNNGELLSDKINIRSHLTVDKGKLVDFTPLYKLSKFIELSELQNITFSRLENNIEISNGMIHIPTMNINSSAINLGFSGTHNFDNVVDYHIKVKLNQLLAKKARSSKKENEEFGIVEQDEPQGGMYMFINMKGPVDNPTITYDKKGWKQKAAEDIASEKKNFKSALKQEFGWFKGDTAVPVPTKKKPQELKLDLTGNESETPPEKNENKKKKGLLEKIAKPNTSEKSNKTSDDYN